MMSLNKVAYGIIFIAFISAIWIAINYGNCPCDGFIPDPAKMQKASPFILGIVVPLLTFGSSLLVIETFRNNNKQNVFNNVLKMIDHNRKIVDNVNCSIERPKSESANNIADQLKNNRDKAESTDQIIKFTSTEIKEVQDYLIYEKGKDFFDELAYKIAFYYDLKNLINESQIEECDDILCGKIDSEKGVSRLKIIYDYYFHIYHSEIGHYFRNLYYIMKYIDDCNISDKFKNELSSILRSQLSNYELLLLAYNGLHEYGTKMKTLLEKYHMLKSLNNETRLAPGFRKRIISDIDFLKDEYVHLKQHWR